MLERFGAPSVVVFLVVLFGLILITFVSTRLYTRALRRKWVKAASLSVEIDARADDTPEDTAEDSVSPRTNETVEEDKEDTLPIELRLQHVLLASLVATVTVTFAKASSELLKDLANGDSSSFQGVAVLVPLVLLISLPAQLHFINTSLMFNDALFHLPVFYVFFVVGGTIGGGVMYDEFQDYRWWRWLLLVLGIIIIFAGVVLAAERLAKIHRVMSDKEGDSVTSPVFQMSTAQGDDGPSTSLQEPLLDPAGDDIDEAS